MADSYVPHRSGVFPLDQRHLLTGLQTLMNELSGRSVSVYVSLKLCSQE